jgi:myxalamid-type nonribosomal peptide synthetase MxaA
MRNIEAFYPLSPLQQGILFETLFARDSEAYFEQLSCTIRSDLNVQAFGKAWQQVVDRHSSLRSAFFWEELKEPVQVVSKQITLPLEEHDWRELRPQEQQRRLKQYLQADRQRGFDMARPPLMRLALMEIDDAAYYFVWSHHHLLLDGWSLPVLLREVFLCYDAFCRDEIPQLKQTRPFRDYVAWLRQQDLSQAETFWREALTGIKASTPLGIDRLSASTATASERYVEKRVFISDELTAAIRQLGRQQQLTLNTFVQGIWGLLLGRYSGQADVVFGATVSGRPASLPGVEEMIGLFINTLPVRVRLTATETVLSYLQNLQSQQIKARQYEYSPLTEIKRWSGLSGDLALFESLLVFENYPVGNLGQRTETTLDISDVQVFEQTNYPLTIIAGFSRGLVLRIIYDCDRFEEIAIERMGHHFRNLLRAIVADPQEQISRLQLFSEPERQQLLIEWNDTSRPYERELSLPRLFAAQVQRTPDAVAVVYDDQQLSYAELDQRSNQLAQHLCALGLGLEDRVALCLPRSLEMVVGMLAIMKAGAAYVPLDPQYPSERLSFMLEDSGVSALLTTAALVERLPLTGVPLVRLDADWPLIARESAVAPAVDVHPQNLAYLIYTSGSTGTPKGVAITQQSAVTLVQWAHTVYKPEQLEAVLASTSLCFDLSVFELLVPLCGGGAVIVAENALALAELPAAREVTLINTVPSAMAELVRAGAVAAAAQTINLAGEALSGRLVNHIYESGRVQQVWNLYGPSEDTTYSTYARCRAGEEPRIGRPVDNTQAYVVDEAGAVVAVGVEGEIWLGGEGLARGYFGRAAQTAERFIPDALSGVAGGRLYRTGDVGRYSASGELEYVGRRDQQVKVRGYRIELGEIEAVLERHPKVERAAVVVRAGQEGRQDLLAYVVAQNEYSVSSEDLRSYLSDKLPTFMSPSAFIMMKSLPLTPNGKVDRKALPEPDKMTADLQGAFVAPRTPPEQVLADSWAEILSVEKVGIHDNFFALGGHSLKATRVINQVWESFHVKLPLKTVFDSPTVAEMAQVIALTLLEEVSVEERARVLQELEQEEQLFGIE